jgi:Tfp pilus assembly protein PilF
VHRETVRLAVLTLIAIVAFLATRLLAQRAERQELQDAAAWYDRGVALLKESNPDDAAVAFRRAVMKHRGEKRYVLGLADALGRSGNAEAATRALLGVREFSPEDADINLALARLERAGARPAEAVRYYHHAIYAPGSTPERARAIRLELVNMLLDADDQTRANAELVAATIDLPDRPESRLELARLFERADNPERAAEQYRRVLGAEPKNVPALEGAVRTAFALEQYRNVVGYRLPDDASRESHELSDIARAILSRDPLASRLSAAERRRRLRLNISYLERRWRECGATPPASPPDYPEALVALRKRSRAQAIGRDSEALENAAAAIDELREHVEQRCGARTLTDRAIEIITRLHGVREP